MKNEAKQLYEKMVDLKRFAVILLAAGVFFYLGV
ncbi:MAG: YrhC family protein, partial [Bacillota bacterium]|nr:YrhC family protein [Bacillota bacterium]